MVEFRLAVVGPDHLEDLSRLFELRRTTRHCRCMAFCSSGGQFAVGWYSGGNRRRFETMAAQGPTGVLALINDEPVGWCACGPRSRFRPAERGRSSPLAGLPCDEDTSVWLVAYTVISPDRRGQGLLLPLLRGAVDLARSRGAAAVEAWPLATGVRRRGMEHVGREAVFVRLGFRPVGRPTPERTIVRLDLTGGAGAREYLRERKEETRGGASIMVKSYRDFPENPQGQRDGSASDAATPQDEPDLIRAHGIDGRIGYVLRADLRGPEPRTPNEAIEMTEAAIAAGPRLIPLWSADGITRIGSFLVNGLPGSMPS